MNNRLTARIPDKKALDEFIMGAEKNLKIEERHRSNQINLPWKNPSLRNDVKKGINLQLPEEYILKIKFISENTNKSQQKILREIISDKLDQIVEEILMKYNG